MSHGALGDVRVKMGGKLRPDLWVTAKNDLIKFVLYRELLQAVGNALHMAHGLVVDVTLDVSRVIPAKPIAADFSRLFIFELLALRDLIIPRIEKTGNLAIIEDDHGARSKH